MYNQTLSNASGQFQYGSAPTPAVTIKAGVPTSVTAEAIDYLTNVSKQLSDIAGIARGTADAVFGAQPEPAQTNGAQAMPASRGDQLRVLMNDVQAQIATLRTQVERLTCI